MSASVFQAAGPIRGQLRKVYTKRDADNIALDYVERTEYVLVSTSPQQGKTSLILELARLKEAPGMNTQMSYVDFSNIFGATETEWYQAFGKKLRHNLIVQENSIDWPEFKPDHNGVLDFFEQLREDLYRSGARLVVALDEVVPLKFDNGSQFFKNLRYLHFDPARDEEIRPLSFIFAGTFNPDDLIDGPTSPFNVALRVDLADFEFDQVYELVRQGPWSTTKAERLAERIYHWTGGHPHLSHALCASLERNQTKPDVDRAVDEMDWQGSVHLSSMNRRLRNRPDLWPQLVRIHGGETVRYSPDMNRGVDDLRLLGWIRRGPDYCCEIRNRIYRSAIERMDLPSLAPQTTARSQVFVSYSHKDDEWKELLLKQLRVLERPDLFKTWDDSQITTGSDWRKAIETALTNAAAAILLVSADFLNSSFIRDEEVPELLRQNAAKGLAIFPIIIRPCPWKRVPWLEAMQCRLFDGHPLSAGSRHDVESALVAIAEEIHEFVK